MKVPATHRTLTDAVARALAIGPDSSAAERTIDITTLGRRSGIPRRVEVWFHRIDGRWYITGMPGPRSWYANLRADPRFIVHLKHEVTADLPATARPVDEQCRYRYRGRWPRCGRARCRRGGPTPWPGRVPVPA